MTEPYENVLRKSLDTADRHQKLGKVSKLTMFLAIGFIVVGELNIVPAMIYMRTMDKYLLFVASFVAGIMFLCGLTAILISTSLRNTQVILRAIQLSSEAAATTGSASAGLSDRREG
jgi:hypothetical protein